MRRAVYDRARAALMDQLRSLEPPLSEGDIARERLALEDAVNRVESEQRRRESFADVISTAALEPAGRPVPEPPPPAPPPPDEEARPPFRPPPASPIPPSRTANRADRARRGEPRAARAPAHRHRRAAGGAERARPHRDPRRGARRRDRADRGCGLRAARPAGGPAAPAGRRGGAAAGPADSKIGDRVAGERAPGRPAPPRRSRQRRAATAPPRRRRRSRSGRCSTRRTRPIRRPPKVTPARAVWRLDNLNAGQGQPLETVVRATVDMPDAKLSLSLHPRRNPDQTLPASHTVELAFTTPPGDPARAVRDVGLLQFKNDETVRGTPVAGLPVPVKENLFLIGLSNLASRRRAQHRPDHPPELDRPADPLLLRPARHPVASRRGSRGEQVVNEAFRQWRQQ